MKLSILIPHLEHRDSTALFNNLEKQLTNDVEVLVKTDSGKATSGRKRNILTHKAKGDYIAFIDDDDNVAETYVQDILTAIEKEPDVVTFNLHYTAPGKDEIWEFSIRNNDRPYGLMCINHLSAWRQDLARKVMWAPNLGFKDDHLWFEPLARSGLAKDIATIPKPLYHYSYHPRMTSQQTRARMDYTSSYIGPGLMCFKDEDDNLYVQHSHDPIMLRNNKNELVPLQEGMQYYHTIK
jgi:glycosyltransferase involved in cell wall biosynthesis